jgi:predicted DsbA family dithiol-disulfide isomerase
MKMKMKKKMKRNAAIPGWSSAPAAAGSPRMKITYYLDVTSSWCFWAEPAWAKLRAEHAGSVEFAWKIALLDAAALPPSRAALEWFYRRSGTITRSPAMLNPGWFEDGTPEYLAPNLVAEAGKDFGVTDDRLRLALARAALVEGRRILQWEVALACAPAFGLDPAALRARAESPEVLARVRASTAEFHALQVTQRPAFVIDDAIGDRAVFSGIWSAAPLATTIEAMLADAAAYASYGAHFGGPPA